MKRLPQILTFFAVLALAASLTYWGMEMYKPKDRPMAVAVNTAAPEPQLEAAASLFGGQPATMASNYQLTGVIAAGSDSAAIISVDGKPAAIKIGSEVMPGVTVVEVYQRYVMLSENGARKRVEIMADIKPVASMGVVSTPNQAEMMQQMQNQNQQNQASDQPPPLVGAPPTPTPPPAPEQADMPPPTRSVGVAPPIQ